MLLMLQVPRSFGTARTYLFFLIGCALMASPALSQRTQPSTSSRFVPHRGNLQAIPDTTQYPWSCLCKVIAEFPDDRVIEGSGAMIGPHHCLTALHLLYDTKTRVAARRVLIIPGYDDYRFLDRGLNSHPFGTTRLKENQSLKEFLFWEAQDIAILITNSNVGDKSSWLTVGARSESQLKSHTYHLAGYPGDTDGAERQNDITVLINRMEKDEVRYDAQVPSGMIGGAIFDRERSGRSGEQDTWTAVGVQTGANVGTRLSPEMLRILRRIIRDDFSVVTAPITTPPRTGAATSETRQERPRSSTDVPPSGTDGSQARPRRRRSAPIQQRATVPPNR